MASQGARSLCVWHMLPWSVVKSVLALFLTFWATLGKKVKTHFLQKWPFPPTELAETLCVNSQTLPRSESRCPTHLIFPWCLHQCTWLRRRERVGMIRWLLWAEAISNQKFLFLVRKIHMTIYWGQVQQELQQFHIQQIQDNQLRK